MADMKEGWRNYFRTTQGMIIVAQIVSKKQKFLYCNVTPTFWKTYPFLNPDNDVQSFTTLRTYVKKG